MWLLRRRLRHVAAAMAPPGRTTGYLGAADAAALDRDLMSVHAFSLDQLMELAGLSVASVVRDACPAASRPIVVCGPGNNGGDGLVAARHLAQFGLAPTVVYPTDQPKQPIYSRLLTQCNDCRIPVLPDLPADLSGFDVIVDAIFGFSFHGDLRAPFDTIVERMNASGLPCVAVDVPSGWHVEQGNVSGNGVQASVLVSLSAPKMCAATFHGRHYLGGRFLPPALIDKFGLRSQLPEYPGSQQFVQITRG
ncbi:hypothetical protein PBRA_007578 [Plasmodiophora brassicae]|uniref:NAD(P)H-hydrate epimerase n=1 Tax=Plasmodiophora brassicae TaxID=37360 RepID=A0A0G4IXJ9_PLABS|nr:hypothetical protein PBRA_007578 [Plasmodiophora brassicae]